MGGRSGPRRWQPVPAAHVRERNRVAAAAAASRSSIVALAVLVALERGRAARAQNDAYRSLLYAAEIRLAQDAPGRGPTRRHARHCSRVRNPVGRAGRAWCRMVRAPRFGRDDRSRQAHLVRREPSRDVASRWDGRNREQRRRHPVVAAVRGRSHAARHSHRQDVGTRLLARRHAPRLRGQRRATCESGTLGSRATHPRAARDVGARGGVCPRRSHDSGRTVQRPDPGGGRASCVARRARSATCVSR